MAKDTYNHLKIEEKWLQFWQSMDLFANTQLDSIKSEDKEYLLFAFAYPSGSGLHVGHVESKTALDILARYKRMMGKKVFFPVGWDAFGLPAENYAIKTGIHPAITTKNAIDTFRRQVKRLGISYDWSKETATNHPEYYRWTQWIFLQLYNKGYAYQKEGKVNWCPSCQTVLANEQVVNGFCERCGAEVIQKDLKQWYFKITRYQDELIEGLKQVDWPTATKQQQLNWIGKKEGINIDYPIFDSPETITCFTTRPDTNFGATFIVLAPEHPFAQKVAQSNPKVAAYLENAMHKTELERQAEGRKKTGVFTGFYAHNRLNDQKLPIWVSDFVLGGFGTGAVIGVPGHDVRDFQFAQAMNLPVMRVVIGKDGNKGPIITQQDVQEEEGTMIHSQFLDGLEIHEATQKIMDYLEEKGWGKRVVTYKLRDWLISRQRYWGAPIPIVYDPQGNPHPVKDEHLPWLLPTDVDFKPTGESPLRSSKEFQERVERLYGKGWHPEYDTMDTFVDSSWYYLRYVDARNKEQFVRKALADKMLPVDLYLIGPEHIVLHLLYSRFFTKFLRDEGYISIDEPFAKMRHQGMILGPNGKKMSKSKGNVINPDEIIQEYGADTLRVYEMFMGPLEADKPWDTRAVAGVSRFLQKIYRLVTQEIEKYQHFDGSQTLITNHDTLQRKLQQTIRKVSQDIPDLKYNTAIASFMELGNLWEKNKDDQHLVWSMEELLAFIKILAPFAPFVTEELYDQLKKVIAQVVENQQDKQEDDTEAQHTHLLWLEKIHFQPSVHLDSWPTYDAELAKEQETILAVQINGKLRTQFPWPTDQLEQKEAILSHVESLEAVQKWLKHQPVKKAIYVPGKLVSLVV